MADMSIGNTIDSISLQNIGTFMLWGDIDEESSYYACEFLIKSNIIFDSNENVTLFINSGGGAVSDGQAIIDVMETSNINIATRAIGQIASMAVSIFIAGTPGMRVMSKNCEVMTHQFTSYLEGKAHELVAVRQSHDNLEDRFIRHFIKHTKMSERNVRDILLGPSDRYLTAQECLKYGICDAVTDPWDFAGNHAKSAKTARKKPVRKTTKTTKTTKTANKTANKT